MSTTTKKVTRTIITSSSGGGAGGGGGRATFSSSRLSGGGGRIRTGGITSRRSVGSSYSAGGGGRVNAVMAAGVMASVGGPAGALQTLSDARMTRAHEKQELSHLNDRFASYIDKVRYLQERNSKLEAQIKIQESREAPNIKDLYEKELRDLRALVDELSNDKAQLEIERNNWQEQAEEYKGKWQDEAGLRAELEAEIERLKKELDAATMARVDLENKLSTAQEEIDFLKRVHDEEIRQLQDQLNESLTIVEVDSRAPTTFAPGPDLTEALREIRTQYEELGRVNREDAEVKYKQKFSELAQQRERDNEALMTARTEVTELRRNLNSLVAENEALKSKNAALEGSLSDLEGRMQLEIEEYQAAIRDLEQELETKSSEMAQQMQAYKMLMDTKMALDMEIAAYRKLLEGEEIRLFGESKEGMQTSSSSSSYQYSMKSGSGGGSSGKQQVTVSVSSEEVLGAAPCLEPAGDVKPDEPDEADDEGDKEAEESAEADAAAEDKEEEKEDEKTDDKEDTKDDDAEAEKDDDTKDDGDDDKGEDKVDGHDESEEADKEDEGRSLKEVVDSQERSPAKSSSAPHAAVVTKTITKTIVQSVPKLIGGGWTLLFKAVSETGGPVFSHWETEGKTNEPTGEPVRLDVADPYRYKSSIIDNWEQYSIQEVKVVLYKDNEEVLVLRFDAEGTNKSDWYSQDRLIESPFIDLSPDKKANGFSFQGQRDGKIARTMFIDGGVDHGWFVVIDKPDNAPWAKKAAVPHFLYSTTDQCVNWNDAPNVGQADVLAIFALGFGANDEEEED
ncbi:PREDICTED: non-neuronal cytoplasmic intermediate filament protein isoform X2 [Branchiostoma belcheri]|uniref:Non-neuronal cytoplasmic intermediate filament protein isoform X1 n=1 Tax=Branchiostoma belcheri TaxID=7741 RepID=A0A6P4Z333_BRABE|nr:PREDICTED: non-neuronal cytoplasmic intermediate filament protein isoform X1 [Branchiostoma belcheri]XP_019623981.1 PREDICTED: non-neuronal cytoplasmic intermediate filament protein isoform X2 [Branchiostoma belcheri]